jgi:hypothetical protein
MTLLAAVTTAAASPVPMKALVVRHQILPRSIDQVGPSMGIKASISRLAIDDVVGTGHEPSLLPPGALTCLPGLSTFVTKLSAAAASWKRKGQPR